MAAGVTIFDPNTVAEVGSFKDPNHYAVGIKYVIVNGQVVVRDGKITEARPGARVAWPRICGDPTALAARWPAEQPLWVRTRLPTGGVAIMIENPRSGEPAAGR
jgi:hypothetical protein